MNNNPRPGFNFAPEYMVPGIPHVQSGSVGTTPAVIEFNNVTRAITVTNNSAAGSYLLVGFTQNGVLLSNNYPLDGGKSVRMEVRVRDLWLKGQAGTVSYGVCAEMTAIERMQMLPLTGSVANQTTVAGQLALTGSLVVPGVG